MLDGSPLQSQVQGLGCSQEAVPQLLCMRASASLPNAHGRTLREGGERPCLRVFLYWAQKRHVWREQPVMAPCGLMAGEGQGGGHHLLLLCFGGSRCCLVGSAGRVPCCQNPSKALRSSPPAQSGGPVGRGKHGSSWAGVPVPMLLLQE